MIPFQQPKTEQNPKKMQSNQALKHDLQSWLQQRKTLIIQFNTLCQLRPFQLCKDPNSLDANIITFCQILIDYIAMGQFQVFEQLLTSIEKKPCNQQAAQELYNRLKQTSLQALTFSDQYTEPFDIKELENDLCTIGELLATRFDLEDDLIGLLPRHSAVQG